MRNWRIGIKIGVAFGLIFVMLVILSISMGVNFRTMRRNMDNVHKLKDALNNIHMFSEHLTKAETGQRGYMITGKEEYLEPFEHAMQHMPDHLHELKIMLNDSPEHQFLYNQLENLVLEKRREMESTIEVLNKEGVEKAREIVNSDHGRELTERIENVIDKILASKEEILAENQLLSDKIVVTTRREIGYTGGFSLLFVILITIYFTQTIARPLQRSAEVAERIANGDISETIQKIDRKDEVGQLINSLSRMSEILQKQIIDIREGIDVLSSTSSEIMSGVAQLASSASETATAIGETTTTIEEVKQTAEVSSYKAKEVSEESKKTARISEEGTHAVVETSENMLIIKQKMETIASVVVNLSEQSHTIGEITATVNDLAEQSNILAVNAAIEAAKAGEQGRGFSVVASEIKNLATRSKEATSQVRNILNEVQKSINKVVMSTEDGGRTVDSGNELIKSAQEAIFLLSKSITMAVQASIQIASSSQEQLVGMDQVVVAMENIRDASSQIAVTTQQASQSVNDLHILGEKLQTLINYYKVEV